MSKWYDMASIRREYGDLSLDPAAMAANPVDQFQDWFSDALTVERDDPTATVLSTVDENGYPDSRVVLLKGVVDGSFLFYSNYESSKAQQIARTPYAALNFYWPEMARQIRLRGRVEKVDTAQSDHYFSVRPLVSQIGAIVSPQSRVIPSRESMDKKFTQLMEQYKEKTIPRPDHWGGYKIIPEAFEFWQGRDKRLHDRVQYTQSGETWKRERLAP